MPDLNTESPHVVRSLHAWIRTLVKTYQIDAIRIDTVKHVRKDFWPDFVREAGVAAIGEILHGGGSGLWRHVTIQQVLLISTLRSCVSRTISAGEHTEYPRLCNVLPPQVCLAKGGVLGTRLTPEDSASQLVGSI
jgi:hypothetical protein